MKLTFHHTVVSIAFSMFALSTAAHADAIRLANGDTINGDVVSLDKEKLTITSKNFGDLTIPRDKVELIYLGQGTPTFARSAATSPEEEGAAQQPAPSVLPPEAQGQLNQLLQQLLGNQNTQQRMDKQLEGLRDLKEDLGPGSEGQALDAYLRMLETLSQFNEVLQPGAKPQTPPKTDGSGEQEKQP